MTSALRSTVHGKNFFLCIVYVSEGSRESICNSLLRSAEIQSAVLAHSFRDVVYNRTSFFFVGEEVASSAFEFCKVAFQALDYASHEGSHPTLGAIDHVCFSPLGSSTIEESSIQARSFAASLLEFSPVYLYAHASPLNKELKEIRKELGYFSINSANKISVLTENMLIYQPDIGSNILDETVGVTCVGSVPFVLNYNMRCRENDPKSLVSQITKHVRSKEVEALTLQHKEGAYEIACNLKNWKSIGPKDVLDRALSKARELGVDIVDHYTTGPTEEDLLDVAVDKVTKRQIALLTDES